MTLFSTQDDISAVATRLMEQFQKMTGLKVTTYSSVQRSDGWHLVIELGNPVERFFKAANELSSSLPDEHPLKGRIAIRKKAPKIWLASPEVALLQRVLSESLTVDRTSFQQDFFSRYIKSVFGAEEQVLSRGNHLVFGRRGSGKSSLLLFGLRTRQLEGRPSAWVAMQTYERRDDLHVVVDVILEILSQLEPTGTDAAWLSLRDKINALRDSGDDLTEQSIRRLVPAIRHLLTPIVNRSQDIYIYIDDLHVISQSLQPTLLSILYAFARGSGIYLKASAIENFTRNWDPTINIGLNVPNDAQVIPLDYNLIIPKKAREHIRNILEAHCAYCGIPSVSVLCREEVITQLVWVGAGVPRDAINLFLQATIKSLQKSQVRVSMSSVNTAASDNLREKLKYIPTDASGSENELSSLLERIKNFCIKGSRRSNAFLVMIDPSHETYKNILKLIDLRLLHVINQSMTVREAGERFMALILDYGFYVSVRTMQNLNLFRAQEPKYEELKALPQFRL